MTARTVRDVIGEPSSWPNSIWGNLKGLPDMQGATVSEVMTSGTEIAVQTHGAASGDTFSAFVIEDSGIRDRTFRAIRRGMTVDEAAAAKI
jgi:hypothetical protein